MSNAEILSLISTISFVIAAISFALAVFLWFKFKIPSVIGDLSGRTARKSIARMRARNERAGGQGYKTSAANASRGRLTDTMHHSRKLTDTPKKKSKPTEAPKVDVTNEVLMPETGLLADNQAHASEEPATEILTDTEATGVLLDQEATAPLDLQEQPPVTVKRTGGKQLTILDEVVLIHTDEVI